jgi:CrcB protein
MINPLIAIAFGGAFGAVLRFLVSSGIYQWLGRGFPYGTLVVNILGSFLIGLLTEALILQKVALSLEYRSAILIGLFGSFTTFSTFSLDTVMLIEQGNLNKAFLNIIISVSICIFAVWLGLLIGRGLFSYSEGTLQIMNVSLPYALYLVNAMGAFLIGFLSALLISKAGLLDEHKVTLIILLSGLFIVLSSLYIALYGIESGVHINLNEIRELLILIAVNVAMCGMLIWTGLWVGNQV